MSKTPTPHIGAKNGEIAASVLMPGDPLRAKFIAENFLEDARCVSQIRNTLMFTGNYCGKKVSVCSSGMGIPSMGIYSYELFHFYGVEQIIRIGTAGSLSEKAKLRDVVLAIGASTDSNYGSQFCLPGVFAPTADFSLAAKAVETAERLGISTVTGNVLTSDSFYGDNADALQSWIKMGILAVEMETAGLYMNAARAGKKALSMLTISDAPLRGESLSAEERQTSFTDMMNLALEIA